MNSFDNETIWIVGASSGIGRALAKHLNDQGAYMILSARREDELLLLNQELGGSHMVLPFDAADFNALNEAIDNIKSQELTVNRAIYMAALYEPQKIANIDLQFMKTLFEVNALGCFAFAKSMLTLMNEQEQGTKNGQIALCGSVAGYTGLPNGQPYSASKAAIRNFTESLFIEAPSTIDIKLISPGFVRTRTTDKNDFDMPYIIEPEQAAKAIANGLLKKGFEVHFPKRFTLQLKFLTILPYWLRLKVTGLLG